MIALDTNQIRAKSPSGPLLRMLHKVATETDHELVLPEMVVEEYLAHYRREVEVALQRVRETIEKLRQLVPSWDAPRLPYSSIPAEAEKIRQEQFAQIFQTLPTPESAWQEALFREARRRPPSKTSWDTPGSGARDVAIWLTVIDACRLRGAETYFVTDNSSDFGKGALLPELIVDLNDRLGADAHLFHYCPNIPALMSELGIENVDYPEAKAIGSASAVLKAIAAGLTDEGPAIFEFVQAIPNLNMKFVYPAQGVVDLRFEKLRDKVVAYRIGGSTWVCLRGTWSGGKDLGRHGIQHLCLRLNTVLFE